MTDSIATFAELESRLDWDLSARERSMATKALEDLSDDARFYGSPKWSSLNAPRGVKSIILRAAKRYMGNPDGYSQSRAGDETIQWADLGEDAGTAYFTSREQEMLKVLAGNAGQLMTAPLVAHGPTLRTRTRYIDPRTPTVTADYGDIIYAQADSGLVPMQAVGEF